MEPRVIVSDFDFTIAHFGGSFEELHEIFRRRGIPSDIVLAAHEVAERLGFTIDRYVAEIKRRVGVIKAEQEVGYEFAVWLASALRLYPESALVLRRWYELLPLVILTAGDNAFQRQKVQAVGIPYHTLHVVENGSKFEVVHSFLEMFGAPLVFIEDNVRELDRIRDEGIGEDEVITVRICRPDSPHRDVSGRSVHCEVNTLEEVNQRFFPR